MGYLISSELHYIQSFHKLFPTTIQTAKFDLIKSHQLQMFNKLIKGKIQCEIASKLMTSLHWYGLAIKDEQEVDRFIKLTVALESMLLKKNEEPKKHLLADRSAFLLGKEIKSRQAIFNLVRHSYSLRGDIIHEGKHEFFKEDTLTLLNLVRRLFFRLVKICYKFQSIDEIDDKIKEIKFGSQIKV